MNQANSFNLLVCLSCVLVAIVFLSVLSYQVKKAIREQKTNLDKLKKIYGACLTLQCELSAQYRRGELSEYSADYINSCLLDMRALIDERNKTRPEGTNVLRQPKTFSK